MQIKTKTLIVGGPIEAQVKEEPREYKTQGE